MSLKERIPSAAPSPYVALASSSSASPPVRDLAARIAELLRPRGAPTRSREEQAFVDLERGRHS